MAYRKIVLTGLLLILVLCGLYAAPDEMPATRRFGIFIGSNNGGRGRVMLRYAVSDAKSVSRVFTGMGGITGEDNALLIEPTVTEINRRIDAFSRLSAQSKRNAQRTELVFYYSGHSDENGILLNRERYGYRELRERINAVQADMSIVILDSCSSGAITRAKGGVKTQPFLFDNSVSTTGYAFLTSSSDTESSQESDIIESSYFTHSLLAGLRGAADSVGDGRVTLNELYRFAYTETLARTETSMYGAQHPSYDIQISGSGDVVLTDIKEISASLIFAEEITGRLSIRDSSDFLVAELTKVSRKLLELGLEPGQYHITLQQGDNFYRADITLSENQRIKLGIKDFDLIAASSGNRNRGNDNAGSGTDTGESDDTADTGNNISGGKKPDSDDSETNPDHHPFSFQPVPGVDVIEHKGENETNNVLIGLIVGIGNNINGIGIANIGLVISGNTHGAMASGIFNMVGGSATGVMAAGIFNIAGGDVHGAQLAGIFNITNGSFTGPQAAGIFNSVNGSFTGPQAAGIFNSVNGSYTGPQAAGIGNSVNGSYNGPQAAGIFNTVNGSFNGPQVAGIFNTTNGTINGIQVAGIFNTADELRGLQTAGIVNINHGGSGAMVGLINISDAEESIVPFGLVNIMKNGILHPSIFIDDMLFTNIGFRSGTKHFYSLVSTGVGGDYFYNRAEDTYFSTRWGFGFEIPIHKAFINIDITSGNIYNLTKDYDGDDDYSDDEYYRYIYPLPYISSNTQTYQLRLSAGYKIFEHLGIFAGISFDYLHKWNKDAPDPRDFGGVFVGEKYGRHISKLGFFGGIQF